MDEDRSSPCSLVSVVDMMLLSKVEQISQDDCCPACKNAEKYVVFKGKNHEGNVRGGNLHKERENVYKQQGTLKEIIT